MKKMATWLLLSTALITPFIVAPNLFYPFLDGKVLFLRGVSFGVLLLITLFLLSNNKKDHKEREELYLRIGHMIRDPLFLAVATSMALLVLSTIFAFDQRVAFFGETQRGEGFLTLFALFSFFVSFYILFKEKEWRTFFMFSSVAALLLFIIELSQVVMGSNRPSALSGLSTYLAGYYIFTIFSGIIIFFEGRKMDNFKYCLLGAGAFLASVLGILLTKTRAVMLGIFVACIICLILSFIFGKKEIIFKRTIRFWAAGLLVTLALLSGLFLSTRHASFWTHVPGLNRVAQYNEQDANTTSRFLFAKESLDSFWGDGGAKRVLFGWGWDNYSFFFQKHYNPQIFYYETGIADRPHNKLLDMLVMTGLLGLMSYVFIWFLFVRKIIKILKQDLSRGLALVFYATTYFFFLFFTFDIPLTILGFYAVVASMSFDLHESKK